MLPSAFAPEALEARLDVADQGGEFIDELRVLVRRSLDQTVDLSLVVGAEFHLGLLTGLFQLPAEALDLALRSDALGPKALIGFAHFFEAAKGIRVPALQLRHVLKAPLSANSQASVDLRMTLCRELPIFSSRIVDDLDKLGVPSPDSVRDLLITVQVHPAGAVDCLPRGDLTVCSCYVPDAFLRVGCG